jgi:hypothetical protein
VEQAPRGKRLSPGEYPAFTRRRLNGAVHVSDVKDGLCDGAYFCRLCWRRGRRISPFSGSRNAEAMRRSFAGSAFLPFIDVGNLVDRPIRTLMTGAQDYTLIVSRMALRALYQNSFGGYQFRRVSALLDRTWATPWLNFIKSRCCLRRCENARSRAICQAAKDRSTCSGGARRVRFKWTASMRSRQRRSVMRKRDEACRPQKDDHKPCLPRLPADPH